MGAMEKKSAIKLLGGTPKKAAQAMGYRAVQTVYQWPDQLPQATADRVAGVLARTKGPDQDVPEQAMPTTQEAAHG